MSSARNDSSCANWVAAEMEWIATLRPAQSAIATTMADALADAAAVISGDQRDQVVAEARAQVAPGVRCVVYQLPPEARGASTSDDPAIARLSASQCEIYTYRAGVTADALAHAERELGMRVPPRWSQYLMAPSVLETSWPDHEHFLRIYGVDDIIEITKVALSFVPDWGAVMIGDCGGGMADSLQLDVRAGDASPVLLFSSQGDSLTDLTVQTETIEEFITLIESDRFEPVFDEDRAYRPRY